MEYKHNTFQQIYLNPALSYCKTSGPRLYYRKQNKIKISHHQFSICCFGRTCIASGHSDCVKPEFEVAGRTLLWLESVKVCTLVPYMLFTGRLESVLQHTIIFLREMHSLVSLLCNTNATENTEIAVQMFKGDEQ